MYARMYYRTHSRLQVREHICNFVETYLFLLLLQKISPNRTNVIQPIQYNYITLMCNMCLQLKTNIRSN